MDQEDDYQVFGFESPPKLKQQPSTKSDLKLEMDPKNSNIFTVMNRGDITIQRAHQKAIIIVGLTRKGKSTTFNWMLGKNLIGYSSRQAENPYYILQVQDDKDIATVGNTYTSVTLAPNVHVDFEKGVSLIDMAGYEDKRNYVGVIGVSYFLKEVFEKVKKVKFVIVISQAMFEDSSGGELIKTFQGFINMFNYRQMKKDVRAKLRQSIVVVVTKSRKEYEHSAKLKIFIQKLSEQDFVVENKTPLLELLSWLLTKLNRLQPFKAAFKDRPAQKCEFINKLTNNTQDPWEFFDIKAAEQATNKSLIAFPFKKDFKALRQQQVKLFTDVIQSRINSYEGFVMLAIQFVKQFFSNWQDFLRPESNPKSKAKNLQFYRDMKQAFEKIEAYVSQNNFYEQILQADKKQKIEKNSNTFMQSLKQIQLIFNQAEVVYTVNGGLFLDHMQKFKEDFPVFVDCFRSFATSLNEHKSLDKLKYILLRGFKEFSRLYQLKQDCINDANAKLRDYFTTNNFFDSQKRKQYEETIIKKMNADIMSKLFTNIAKIEEYEMFLAQYELNNEKRDDEVFLKEHRVMIQNLKATLYLKEHQKTEAACCYIRIYNNLDQASGIVQKLNHQTDQQKNHQLNNYSMKKIKAVRRLVQILKVLPQTADFDPINEALLLCQYHRMIQDEMEIYDLLINIPNTPVAKLKGYYDMYVNYCAHWGVLDKAIQLLKKKNKLEQQDYNSYMANIQLMKCLNTQRSKYEKQFTNNLLSITRLPIQDNTCKIMFAQLQFKLNMKSAN